jgi:hypothetical protein
LHICMSPWMCSGMNPCIRSQTNDWRQFIIDVGTFALAVALLFPMGLPFGAIADS